MTDEQVRTLLPDLLERAAIEEHLADGCNDGSPLEREHLDWAKSLRAIAAHLEAGLAERNADAGRVERVRQALANWTYYCERRVSHDPTVELRDEIRAALGPRGGGDDD